MYIQHHHPSSNNNNNNSPSSSSTPTRTHHHAFGHQSDHSDSDEDDQDLGFQVYRDQPSNARYLNLATTAPINPIDPSFHRHSIHPSSNHSSSQHHLHHPQAQHHPPTYHHPRSSPNEPSHPSPPPPPALQPPYTPLISPYKLSHHHPISSSHQSSAPPNSDLVPMPALGSDWEKDESKRDKDWEGKDKLIDKSKWLDRKNKVLHHTSHVDHQFRDFLAGRRRLAGWFTRWIALAITIFLLILAALLSFFLVPRIPTIAYNNETTLVGDSSNGLSFDPLEPVKFRFKAKINLAMEAHTSFVRPKTSSLRVTLKDLSSSSSTPDIATGSLPHPLVINNKDYTPFDVDLLFSYSSTSKKDLVWNAWHEACGHKWPGKEDRPTIGQVGIIVQFTLKGRSGVFEERTILNNVTCPAELSASAP